MEPCGIFAATGVFKNIDVHQVCLSAKESDGVESM